MPDRTRLDAEDPKGMYPVKVGWLTFTPGDSVNGNSVALKGRYIVYAKNTGEANNTVMVRTSPDAHGRTDDLLVTIVSGAIARFDGITNLGFMQSDRCFWIDVSSPEVELAVWKLDR